MRILVAPDKYKGSLDACAVAESIAAGLRIALPDAEITLLPVADGGEGTAEVICAAAHGEWVLCPTRDANGRAITARYALIEGRETAVLETSESIGLVRIPSNERDPLTASSFGVGLMLRDAAGRGTKRIIVGLGGSATNDGGVGMARALGFRFLDAAGEELGAAVPALRELARIETPAALRLPQLILAADVRNPLLGARGATRVYAPQKGASPDAMEILEQALARLADVVASDLGVDHRVTAGAGAAGGLGFGLMTFASAIVRPGFEVVAEAIGLEVAVRAADVVITGEGRLDAQTLEGKVPAGVAELARKHGKRCYAIVGSSRPSERRLFHGVVDLVTRGVDLDRALASTRELLKARAMELAASF